MPTFILLATILTLAAAAVVSVPLLRVRKEGGRAPWAAAASALVLAIGAAALYGWLSNWSWRAPDKAATPETMVAQLARRLERNPDDLEGWLKLGRSYLVLQQYPLAARAYQRADRLSGGRNVDALTGLAEALVLGDETELDGRAGRLLEQALAVDPRSPKALYYGALTAMRRGDLPLARQRFAGLLALDPPENIRPVLERQIATLDAQIAAGTSGPAIAASENPKGSDAATATAPDGASAAPSIRARVTLGDAVRGKFDVSAPLFVIVREAGVRGPPLAVKRLESRFPQSVELTAADSMLAGRSFKPGQDVEVVARIARTGNPVGASGDPFGLLTSRVGDSRTLDLVIDRLTP